MKTINKLLLMAIFIVACTPAAHAQGLDDNFSDIANWGFYSSTSENVRNAFDGDPATRWTSRRRMTGNEVYAIDFSKVKSFDTIVLDSEQSINDYPREYTVSVSEDGLLWTTVATGNPEPAAQVEITFDQQNARYLRIQQTESVRRWWWSIHEMNISLENPPVELPTQEPIEEPNDERPNILLVITDDQGLDASAQYSLSDDVPNTPVLDELAASGITYDNVWATPSCAPTRAAMLTGKHAINNGVPSTPGTLSPAIGTIQQHLQEVAPEYATGAFGKWHIGDGDSDLDHPASLGVQHFAGNLRGNIDSYTDWVLTTNGVQSDSNRYHTSAIVDLASQWMNEQDQPWFAWLAFAAPHSPFHLPPARFNSRNLSGTAQDIAANPREYYLAAIETLDAELGRLLDSMSDEERENTVVIVIGDNGTPARVIDRSVYANSHQKGSLFEGGLAVPLVISGQGVNRNNVRESGLVNIVDLFPTISALTGNDNTTMTDGYNLVPSFTAPQAVARSYSYADYISDNPLGSGWAVRSDRYKYIAYEDGSEALYDLASDLDETSNLFPVGTALQQIVENLRDFGLSVRGESEPQTQPTTPTQGVDITDAILTNDAPDCADHVVSYFANATDVGAGINYMSSLQVSANDSQCIFNTNVTPNHAFNDGATTFANDFSVQSDEYRVPRTPEFAASNTPLSLSYDDAILLNGVKVDLLAAACFGVGDGRIGCNDDSQPWRYDPMFEQNGFAVDTHNAHTQPNGSYHYHGDPNALFDRSGAQASAVVGFAADGFPVFGSYIEENGVVREIMPSFQIRPGRRGMAQGSPRGPFDGTYRDDYEYVAGSGDLDECNGMVVDGQYAYYITSAFPYVMSCFKGEIDESFRK